MSISTVSLSVATAPSLSVAVASHCTMSSGLTSSLLRCRMLASVESASSVKPVVVLVQMVLMLGASSSSSSLAVAAQVSVVLVVTPVSGVMLTLSTVGSVFCTSMLALLLSLAGLGSSSLTVAVQVRMSPGEEVAVVRVSVLSSPSSLLASSSVLPLLQA